MTSHPATASFKEFAQIAKFKPSYITQLKGEGRLVLTDDGKRVRVAESLQRIADTKDPSKIAVARRHAAEREAAATQAAADADGDGASSEPGVTAAKAKSDDAGYQHWRERSERAKALQAERENAIAEGKLLAADDVAHVVRGSVVTLRTRLESIPDTLAPQLAVVSEEAKVRTLLASAIEHALNELERQFNQLARAA